MRISFPGKIIGFVLFIGAILSSGQASAQTTAPSDAAAARAAIIARWKSLQNLSAEYTRTFEHLPQQRSINLTTPSGTLRTLVGTEEFEESFSYLHGMARWTSQMSPATVAWWQGQNVAPNTGLTYVFRDGRLDSLLERPGNKQFGSIDGHGRGPDGSFIEVGLGLRAEVSTQMSWVTADRLAQMDIQFDEKHRSVFRESQTNGSIHAYTFDPDVGYALCKYRVESETHEPFGHRPEEILVEDFRKVDDVLLPFLIVQHFLRADGTDLSRQTIKVESYTLNDPANVESQYVMKWPKGIPVTDHRAGIVVRTTVDDDILTDQRIEELRENQQNQWLRLRSSAATQPATK